MKRALLALILFTTVNSYSLDIERQNDLLVDFLWGTYAATPAQARPKVGLALSAGGARGFAHVGVLEVLENASVPVDVLGGTSMGAVVGSFYAAGVPLKEIWQIGFNAEVRDVSNDFSLMGVFRFLFEDRLPSSEKFEDFIARNVGGKDFEELNIPFSCAAMDVKTGEKVLFNSGPVAIAVRASMNLPGVFEPVQYRHRYLVDGGVVDYLPVDNVRNMGANYVIAVRPLQDISEDVPQTVAGFFMRTADIRGAIIVEETLKRADFVLQPKVLGVQALDADLMPAAGEEGLKDAYLKLPELKKSILLFNAKYEKK